MSDEKKWEKVNKDTLRLSVPGGWLYATWSEREASSFACAFVPDPEIVFRAAALQGLLAKATYEPETPFLGRSIDKAVNIAMGRKTE